MWNIKFLNQTVVDEFETINCDLQARLLKLFERVKIYGANLGEPHTKNLEDGLFELRAKASSGIARSIFYPLCLETCLRHRFACFATMTEKR
jgi:hypothetical protein